MKLGTPIVVLDDNTCKLVDTFPDQGEHRTRDWEVVHSRPSRRVCPVERRRLASGFVQVFL